tara:strand:- start:160 stop:498 length:339 start_codon:yes stop_codon:yes gene_type:complete
MGNVGCKNEKEIREIKQDLERQRKYMARATAMQLKELANQIVLVFEKNQKLLNMSDEQYTPQFREAILRQTAQALGVEGMDDSINEPCKKFVTDQLVKKWFSNQNERLDGID